MSISWSYEVTIYINGNRIKKETLMLSLSGPALVRDLMKMVDRRARLIFSDELAGTGKQASTSLSELACGEAN